MKRRRTRFKHAEIVEYWFPFFDANRTDAGKFYCVEDMTGACFRCGWLRPHLELAHIVALCEGGNDSIDNIHLLCSACHKATEGKAYTFGRAAYDAMVSISMTDGMIFHIMRAGFSYEQVVGAEYEPMRQAVAESTELSETFRSERAAFAAARHA